MRLACFAVNTYRNKKSNNRRGPRGCWLAMLFEVKRSDLRGKGRLLLRGFGAD